MPTASQLPRGFTHDESSTKKGQRVPFVTTQTSAGASAGQACPAKAPAVVSAILGWQNYDIAVGNHFLGGARSWVIGPHAGANIPLGTPQIWIAIALFPDVTQARSVMRALFPKAPQFITQDTVTPASGLGTPVDPRDAESVPALHGTLIVRRPDGSQAKVEYLTFVRSSAVVEVTMTNPDGATVMRLGKIIDANLVEDGKR